MMFALEETASLADPARASGGNELEPAYAQFRDQSRFWIQRVAVPILMVIGLFGNSITIIIMTRRRMRSTTNMYLAALAFVDMLYLVLTFLLGLSHYPNMAASKYYAYWKLRPFLMMLTDACSNTSVWLTVTFTIERFIAVKYPMKGKVWCTEVRAKMLIVGVFLFGILFASPVPFEWKVIEKVVPNASNNSSSSSSSARLGTNQKISDIGGQLNKSDITADSSSSSSSSSSTPSVPLMGPESFSMAETEYHDETDFLAKDTNSTYSVGQIEERLVATPKETTYNIILALDYSDFGRNETYKTIYYWSTAVIFYFIPLFSLMLFNGFLIKSVHQSKRERTKMVSASESSGHHSTISKTDSTDIVQLNGATGHNNQHQPASLDGGDNNCSFGAYQNRRFRSLSFSSWRKRKRITKNHLTSSERNCRHKSPLINEILVHEPVPEEPRISKSKMSLPSIEESLNSQSSGVETKALPTITGSPTIDGNNKSAGAEPEAAKLSVQSNCDSDKEKRGVVSNDESIHMNRERKQQQSKQIETLGAHGNVKQQGSQEGKTSESLSTSTLIRNSSFRKTITSLNPSSKTSNHPQSQAPVSSQERRITIMLIAVVILFLICQIPSAAMLLYTSVRDIIPNTNEHALVLAFGNWGNLLMAVNSASNFMLYCSLSKKYRKTFLLLFCKCTGSKQKYSEPRRVHSVRFEQSSSNNQFLKTHLSTSSKVDSQRDTTNAPTNTLSANEAEL